MYIVSFASVHQYETTFTINFCNVTHFSVKQDVQRKKKVSGKVVFRGYLWKHKTVLLCTDESGMTSPGMGIKSKSWILIWYLICFCSYPYLKSFSEALDSVVLCNSSCRKSIMLWEHRTDVFICLKNFISVQRWCPENILFSECTHCGSCVLFIALLFVFSVWPHFRQEEVGDDGFDSDRSTRERERYRQSLFLSQWEQNRIVIGLNAWPGLCYFAKHRYSQHQS